MDEGPWERLVRVLDAQADLCTDLACLGESKKEALISGNLADVEVIIEGERALIGKAMTLDRERQAVEQEIALLFGSDCAPLSLPKIIELSAPEYASRLMATKERITANIREIGRLNEINSQLIKQCLRYVNFILKQISIKNGKPYGPEGSPETLRLSVSSWDAKV